MPYADFRPAVRVPLDTLSHRSDTYLCTAFELMEKC